MTEKARAQLEQGYRAACDALKAIPGVGSGANGLTPDAVRSSPAYKTARLARDRAFNALRTFNAKHPRKR